MDTQKIDTVGKSGFPTKRVLNFDEETYSELTKHEYYPVQIKVPKVVAFEKVAIVGHPYFVDDKQYLWSASGAEVYKRNLDGGTSELFIDMTSVDPQALYVEFIVKTIENSNGDYNLLVSTSVLSGREGGRIYLSTDKGVTWTKVLDANDMGLNSVFRISNVWHHVVGDSEYIVVGSYGTNNPEDESSTNGIWLSKDKGVTWNKIFTLPLITSGSNNHVHAICVSPSNGWLWVPHGDGLNRGIYYSHDFLYADEPTFTALSQGAFGKGGWQPSSVVSTILGASFGTDTGIGWPNGILSYDLPDRTMIDKLGFRAQVLHDDDFTHISRRGAQINYTEAYIVMHIGASMSKIFVTGDAGFSWHQAITFPFGAFEKGMTNPDKDGYVYGAGTRFKVKEWETVTKWVKGRFAEKTNYI